MPYRSIEQKSALEGEDGDEEGDVPSSTENLDHDVVPSIGARNRRGQREHKGICEDDQRSAIAIVGLHQSKAAHKEDVLHEPDYMVVRPAELVEQVDQDSQMEDDPTGAGEIAFDCEDPKHTSPGASYSKLVQDM